MFNLKFNSLPVWLRGGLIFAIISFILEGLDFIFLNSKSLFLLGSLMDSLFNYSNNFILILLIALLFFLLGSLIFLLINKWKVMPWWLRCGLKGVLINLLIIIFSFVLLFILAFFIDGGDGMGVAILFFIIVSFSQLFLLPFLGFSDFFMGNNGLIFSYCVGFISWFIIGVIIGYISNSQRNFFSKSWRIGIIIGLIIVSSSIIWLLDYKLLEQIIFILCEFAFCIFVSLMIGWIFSSDKDIFSKSWRFGLLCGVVLGVLSLLFIHSLDYFKILIVIIMEFAYSVFLAMIVGLIINYIKKKTIKNNF